VAGLGDLAGLDVPVVSEKALRDLRRRVGVAPLERLFQTLAGPVGQPGTPGVRYRRWRTVAFDGCKSIRVPDTDRNRAWFGRACYRQAWAGYPMVMLMTLVETGTRALIGAAWGTPAVGEVACSTAYGDVWAAARTLALTPVQVASPLARRPYDLRHAAVSLWLNAGVPATEVARRAGHSVDVLLRVYAKCIDGQDTTVNRRIDEALDE
jgi:hypothetical protein